MAATTETKQGWGDIEEDELPPTNIDRSKENLKIVTEYKKNEKNETVAIIKTYKVRVQHALVSPAIEKRKQWKKFGMCAGMPPGPEKGTTDVSSDEFVLQLGVQQKQAEVKEDKTVYVNIECRICKKKGEHYTANCPLGNVLRGQGKMPEEEEAPAAPEPGKPALYKAPARRLGASEEVREARDELPTVRVSNLSEYANEGDLQELFKPFGPIQRVFIAKDKVNGTSRGFGFVTFYHREDAKKAIGKLDGYGYDHLILHLEWALPSKK